ncbi:MAG TPA: HD family phosphohydrolase [Pseudonocardiaceae bacterium]|nr:HD family phosphohydrolase [Pseudonocardiaceae bacterium]
MTPEVDRLRGIVEDIYLKHASDVPYHGWHHIKFVVDRVSEFISEVEADELLTIAAALVHDLNYIVAGDSAEAAGSGLRREVLLRAGFEESFADTVEGVIAEARTSHRHANISAEAKVLSDGDTAYKVLPITPLMTLDYLTETGVSLRTLASKIVREQKPLLDQGAYFYTAKAQQRYGAWAEANLKLWIRVFDSLEDPTVNDVLRDRGRSVQ